MTDDINEDGLSSEEKAKIQARTAALYGGKKKEEPAVKRRIMGNNGLTPEERAKAQARMNAHDALKEIPVKKEEPVKRNWWGQVETRGNKYVPIEKQKDVPGTTAAQFAGAALGSFAGWPGAWAGAYIGGKLWNKHMKEEDEKINILKAAKEQKPLEFEKAFDELITERIQKLCDERKQELSKK